PIAPGGPLRKGFMGKPRGEVRGEGGQPALWGGRRSHPVQDQSLGRAEQAGEMDPTIGAVQRAVQAGEASRPLGRVTPRYEDRQVLCPGARLSQSREGGDARSEEHTSELQSRFDLVCRLLLEKKK